jgi:hypothetical protein
VTTFCLAVEGCNFLSKVSQLCSDKGLSRFQNSVYLGVQEMHSLAQKSLSVSHDNKVRELIVVKVLHTSLLNIIMVIFKMLPFGSDAPMPAHSPPIKTILELVLWYGLQSCRHITPDIIKMPHITLAACSKMCNLALIIN